MEEGVSHLIRRVTLSIDNDCDRRVSMHGLTSTQCAALLQLQRGGRSTAGDLARALAVDPSGMTRMLDRLERKKMIVRVRAIEDRRVVHIELTTSGDAVIADTRAAPDDAIDAHLVGFTQTERLALESYLVRMLVNGEGVRRSRGDVPGGRSPPRPR